MNSPGLSGEGEKMEKLATQRRMLKGKGVQIGFVHSETKTIAYVISLVELIIGPSKAFG
jgi:hypothetical protein